GSGRMYGVTMAAHSYNGTPRSGEPIKAGPISAGTTTASDVKYRRYLSSAVIASAIVGCTYLFSFRSPAVPAANALLAIVVILLSLAPTVIYLQKKNPEPMPVLPLIGLFYLIAFALPVF